MRLPQEGQEWICGGSGHDGILSGGRELIEGGKHYYSTGHTKDVSWLWGAAMMTYNIHTEGMCNRAKRPKTSGMRYDGDGDGDGETCAHGVGLRLRHAPPKGVYFLHPPVAVIPPCGDGEKDV
jgi:hypothetical protein